MSLWKQAVKQLGIEVYVSPPYPNMWFFKGVGNPDRSSPRLVANTCMKTSTELSKELNDCPLNPFTAIVGLIGYSLGHSWSSQTSILVLLPAQLSPPNSGAELLQLLAYWAVPSPQVLEQVDDAAHSLQPP